MQMLPKQKIQAKPEKIRQQKNPKIPGQMRQHRKQKAASAVQETVSEEQTDTVPDSETTAPVSDADSPVADDGASMDAAAEEQLLSSFDLTDLPDEGMEWAGF